MKFAHDARLACVGVGVYRSTWGKRNPSKIKQKGSGVWGGSCWSDCLVGVVTVVLPWLSHRVFRTKLTCLTDSSQ